MARTPPSDSKPERAMGIFFGKNFAKVFFRRDEAGRRTSVPR
jgi:hypothetical protein